MTALEQQLKFFADRIDALTKKQQELIDELNSMYNQKADSNDRND